MLGIGIGLVVVGVLWSAFKGWVVWDVARDPYGGGGVPTIDFPLFCPVPIAIGISMIVRALGGRLFLGFGFVVYFGLAACFWFLLWHFYRVGAIEKQRQRDALQRQPPMEDNARPARHP